MKTKVIILTVFLIFLISCTTEIKIKEEVLETVPDRLLRDSRENNVETISELEKLSWQGFELKDVNSGQLFKISDFLGKKVVLESFAVWCPICLQQQQNIKKLHQEVGDSVISVSLDTDPNEDEQLVREHIQDNGLTWRFAVAPKPMGQKLVDEFGISVVNAPGAPVILVCEDGATRLMKRGIKSVAELKEEINTGC